MLASMAVFVVNDTLMKLAAGHLPTGEAIFLRGLLTTALGAALIVASGALRALPHALSPTVLWRAAADLGGTITFLSALVHMPMADIFGILQFVPLAVTAGAALFMGAQVGWRRWTGDLCRPRRRAADRAARRRRRSPRMRCWRSCRCCSRPRAICCRAAWRRAVPPLVIVTTSAAVVTLASLGFSLFETWTQPVARNRSRSCSSPAWRCWRASIGWSRPCAPARSPWSRRSAIRSFCGPSWRAIWSGSERAGLAILDRHRHRHGGRSLHLLARAAAGEGPPVMTDNLRGIVAVLVSSVAFVLNDVCVKLVSDELPSGEILVVRGVLATAMLAAGVVAFGAVRPLGILLTPMMLLRLASAAGATVFIVISLRYLPLATVITVLQVTPLAVTAGAAIIYREQVGWRRWLAALTGLSRRGADRQAGRRASAPSAYLALVDADLYHRARPHHARPAPRHPLDVRRRGERCRHHAGRLPGCSLRRSRGACPRAGPGP